MASSAPSQFARILKSSKFASFDPALGQVYTAPPAHAARGNYGLKRALHPRRHGIPLTVQAVDSIDQQTEWEPAATEARYVERWETQLAPQPRKDWLHKLGSGTARSEWRIDTEFAPAAPPARVQPKATARQGQGSASTLTVEQALAEAEAKYGPGPAADLAASKALAAEKRELNQAMNNIPALNPDTLSPERFERYLHDIRALRPRFKRFIAERAKADAFIARVEAANGSVVTRKHTTADMIALASKDEGGTLRKMFMAAVARERYSGAHGGVAIAAQPHRAAGLTYAPPAPLTHYFLSKPEPGRYVDIDGSQNQNQAVFGGVKATFDQSSKRRTDGAPQLRVVAHNLKAAPTLGRGIADVQTEVQVSDVGGVLAHRAVQARPGSREWVAGNGASNKARVDVLPLMSRSFNEITENAMGSAMGMNSNSQAVLDMLSAVMGQGQGIPPKGKP